MRIAAYILLAGAVQSFEGELGTKVFKMGVVKRQGMVLLIAQYVVLDTWRGDYISYSRITTTFPEVCSVIGVHLDRPMLENSDSIC